jgi:hypothetical protein
MARPWTEVVADPNFQALAPDAQEQARNAYFQQNVLPNIPQDANASAIRLKFDQATVPTLKKAEAPKDPSLLMAPVGAAEMLGKLATGAVASIPAGLAYGGAAVGKAFGADVNPAEVQRNVQNYFTYQPQSDSAKAAEQDLATTYSPAVRAVGTAADQAASAVGRVSPTAETLLREAPAAFQAAGSVLPLAPVAGAAASGVKNLAGNAASALERKFTPAPSPGAVLENSYTNTPQSMGAAAAAPKLGEINPDLRQAVSREAQKNGGLINPEVFDRHLQAQSLPVPISYTEGQATRSAPLYSEEQNLRGKLVAVGEHLGDQNKKLGQNVQAIRDQIGPDVFSTNNVEHGDTLMGAYQDIDKAANDQINAAYKQARDMVPDKNASVMSAPELMSNVTKALHEQDLFDSAPKDIMATLSRRAENGSMTFANIENMKTNLARIQRSISADGNTRYAAGLIRDQLEQMPLTVDNPQVQAAYNDARSLARARFQAMDADPAYKAVVNEKVAPDDFVRRFVINGKRDDVSTMSQALHGNDRARQTMAVAVLDHLRDKAGLGSDYRGSFKQSGFNNALADLDPKLRALVDPRTAQTLQDLGEVAHNIQVAPPGHTVNSSNTLTAGLSDYAQGAAEHAVNAKFGGLPVGTFAKKQLQKVTQGARIRQAIQPGAGIGRLANTSPRVEAMLEAARRKAAQQVTP